MAKFKINKFAPKKNDIPFSPFLRIELSEFAKDENDNIILSPQLMTESEIDYNFNSLIDQLQKLKTKAKKELKNKGQT